MDGRELVAWNLRRLRVQEGLSQEALGADAGVDRAYVGKLERGAENPTIALLGRLAKALKVPVSEFFVKPRSGDRPPLPLKGGRRGSKHPGRRLRS
jgi:transcriptional regulator with XRE-family HTH domain